MIDIKLGFQYDINIVISMTLVIFGKKDPIRLQPENPIFHSPKTISNM